MAGALETGSTSFPDTPWSQIRACQELDSALQERLDRLFRRYWRPVYTFIRHGWSDTADDAKDLTQAYFLGFLERDFLRHVQESKGSFRSFVRASLKNFLLNQKRARNARKRRPDGLFSLDRLADAGFDPVDRACQDPAALFDLAWARAVVDAALERLRRLAAAKGWPARAELLARYELCDGKRPSHAALAAALALDEGQVRHGLVWARKHFSRLLRVELREQVSSADELATELEELFG